MAFGFGDYDSSLLGSRHLAFQRRQGEALKLVLPVAQQQVQQIAEERTAFGPQQAPQGILNLQNPRIVQPRTLTEQQRQLTGGRLAQPQAVDPAAQERLDQNLTRFQVEPQTFIEALEILPTLRPEIEEGADNAFLEREAIALSRVAAQQGVSPTELVASVQGNDPALVALQNTVGQELSRLTEEEFPETLGADIVGGAVQGALTVDRFGRKVGAGVAGAVRLGFEQTGAGTSGIGAPFGGGGLRPGRATELVEEKGLVPGLVAAGEEVPFAPDILNPVNLIPIPVIDPLLGRALGAVFKAGARMTPQALRRLVQRATVIVADETAERAVRQEAQQFVDEALQQLAQDPTLASVARAGPEPVPVTQAVEGPFPGLPGMTADEVRAARVADTSLRGAPTGEIPFATSQQPVSGLEPEQFVQGQGGRFAGFEEAPQFEVLQEQARDLGVRLDESIAAGIDPTGPALERAERVAEQELRRALLPTQRQIEAMSARMPIAEKTRIASEQLAALSPGQRPLSVDEVAAQWGERYKSNWFTKLDDITAGVRGKNRPLEKAVRDTMVTRDIYMQTEGMVQSTRIGSWLGRNADLLGLDMNSGRALAIEVRPDAKIPEKARQYLDDIVENGQDYIISPEQGRALTEAQELFTVMKDSNFSHGVEFDVVDPATYWPRRVTGAPKGSNIPVYRAPGQDISAMPGFAKERLIPTRRQGVGAGVKYENPITAMFGRLVGGAEANANRWSVREIQRLGYKPSERISTRLAENLKAAQEAAQAARRTALRSGTSVDEEAARQAAIQLDIAKASMRAEAAQLSARSPRVFGRVVAPDISEELGRYFSDESPGFIDDMFHLMRGTMVGGDNSAMLLQNWALFWRNNPAWLKASAMGLSAFKSAPYSYVARNQDVVEQAVRLGFAHPPTEFLLSRGGRVSRLVAEAPGYKQSQRAFEWNIFIGQVERYKALAKSIDDPQTLIDVAAVTRKQGGIFWLPGQTRAQAKAQSRTFFAPQFLAALQTTLTDPLLARNAAARIEAMKSLSMMFGGAAAATVGFHALINDGELPNMTDPNRQGFWAIKVGGTFVHPFGPFQPLITAMAKTAQGDAQAFPRFVESKASLPVRWFLRAAEAMGVPLEDVRGPAFTQPERTFTGRGALDTILDVAPLPIGAAQTVEGVARGEPLTSLELLGGRTTVQSASDKLRRAFEEQEGREYRPAEGDRAIAEANPRLAPLLKAADAQGARRGRDFAVDREERETQQVAKEEELRLPELAQRLQAGEPVGPGFVAAYEELLSFRATQLEIDFFGQDEGSEEQNDYQQWAAIRPQTFLDEQGLVDWDAYFKQKDAAFARLRPALRRAIETRLRAIDPTVRQVEAEYRKAKELRNKLFDIPKYIDLSIEDGERVDDILFEMAPRIQLEALKSQGIEMERSQAVLLAIQAGIVSNGKVAKFLSDHFGPRPSFSRFRGQRRRRSGFASFTPTPPNVVSPERDDFLIENQEVFARFFPDILERDLNREQQAALEERAFRAVLGG